jgi:hypothetical protein
MTEYQSIGQLYIVKAGLLGGDQQIWGKTWTEYSKYVDDSENEAQNVCEQDCSDTKENVCLKGVGKCVKKLIPRENSANVPHDAKAVLLRVKVQAYIPLNSQPDAYCQIDVKLKTVNDEFEKQNHAIHTEEHGASAVEVGDRRRIAYTSNVVPLNSDGTFFASIRRRNTGNCNVSISIFVEGYFK